MIVFHDPWEIVRKCTLQAAGYDNICKDELDMCEPNRVAGKTQLKAERVHPKTYDRIQYTLIVEGRSDPIRSIPNRTEPNVKDNCRRSAVGQTRYQAEVMLSAKEQRATEIIIYELRKWDDESHTDCQ